VKGLLHPGDYNYGEPGSSDQRVYSETGCTCVLITSLSDVLHQICVVSCVQAFDSARMKVILTGATGMVGEGVLLECLSNPLEP
jgi:hypothetical protein